MNTDDLVEYLRKQIPNTPVGLGIPPPLRVQAVMHPSLSDIKKLVEALRQRHDVWDTGLPPAPSYAEGAPRP